MSLTTDVMLKPDDFVLEGLYADIDSSDLKNIEIYTNGCMQARIYVGYGYLEPDFDLDPESLDDFVRSHIRFYAMGRDGTFRALGWDVSAMNNGYDHDTHLTEGPANDVYPPWSTIFARRVPLYLTPPADFPEGITYVCAMLEGAAGLGTCDSDFPVRIRTRKFRVNASDFEIRPVRASGNARLHELSYDGNGDHCLPQCHRLTQWLNPGGRGPADPTKWIAMQWSMPSKRLPVPPTIGPAMSAIIDIQSQDDFASQKLPYFLEADAIFYDKGGFISNVGNIYNIQSPGSLPILCVHDSRMPANAGGITKKLDFTYERMVVDNYGNRMLVSINWGYMSSWYERWTISHATLFLG